MGVRETDWENVVLFGRAKTTKTLNHEDVDAI